MRVLNDSAWLYAVRRRASGEVDIWLSDLRNFYERLFTSDYMQEQLDSNGVVTTVDKILDILLECFDGIRDADKYEFRVRPLAADDPRGSLELEWLMSGVRRLTFLFKASQDPSSRLRDEVMLPMMRTTEQLRLLVPLGVQWQAPPPGPLPLPRFGDPLLRQVLDRAGRQADSALQVPHHNEGETGGSSVGSAVTAAESHEDVSPFASAQPLSGSEEEAKRKRVQEVREKRAKAKAKEARK